MLICNADDFGLGKVISDSIIECHSKGIVTSTTLMANMPAAEYACRLAQQLPSLGVGVHLNLTEGFPVSPTSKVPDLIDGSGQFPGVREQFRRLRWGWHLTEQLERELSAQIQRAIDFGIQPTHCDSHHGIHKLPPVRNAMIQVMLRFNISKARLTLGYYWTASTASLSHKMKRNLLNISKAAFIAVQYWNRNSMLRSGIRTPTSKVTPNLLIPYVSGQKTRLMTALQSLQNGVWEVVLHPGLPDPAVNDPPSFAGQREEDYMIARDPEIRSLLNRLGIKLISFKQL